MMTKNLCMALVMMAPVSLLAQTRTSVANGNATNPFTWDCTCIPLPGNNIVINHNVVLDNDFAYTSGNVTINAGGSLTGTTTNRIFGLTGGSFVNHGTLTIYNLFHSGGSFTNNGTITVTNGFAIAGTANTQNNGTLNVNDSLLIDVNATLTNPAITHAKYTASAGAIGNTGTFTGDNLYSSGTITNGGFTGISVINLYTNGNITNNAPISISNDLWNSENVTNNAPHEITIGHDLLNGDSIAGTAVFTNNGYISITHDFNNSETVNGSGNFCIGQGSNNAGDVLGTLYICDQTGSNFDFNVGTIGGSVTFCSSGTCILGTNDVTAENVKSVYPNPVINILNIEMQQAGIYHLTLLNGLGQAVSQKDFTGNRTSLDFSGMAPGVYVYRISGNGQEMSGKLVKE